MSAAEREAERRFPLWLPTGDYEIDREDYSELDAEWQNAESWALRRAFVAGAEWQAEQDADLRAERDAAREALDRAHQTREAGVTAATEITRLHTTLAAVRAVHQCGECLDIRDEYDEWRDDGG